MLDYDDIVCPICQHIGVLPDGGYDWICPECGYEGTLDDSEYDEEDYEEDNIESIFDDDGFLSQDWDDEDY